MVKYLLYNDNGVNIFWQIEVIGDKHIITSGKVGKKGEIEEKKYSSNIESLKEGKKIIEIKISEGYIEQKDISIEKKLKNHINKDKDIFECVVSADYENLKKILIENDSIVNIKNIYSYSPLCECICQLKDDNPDFFKCIKILIEYKADVNFVSNNGGHEETPLTLAIKKKSIKMIKLLLENGADVNQSIEFDEPPLIYALENALDNIDIIKLLLEKGAFINFISKINPDYPGYSPLHFAVEERKVELVKLFLKYNADVNQKDKKGRKPIELLYTDYDMDEGFDYDNDEEDLDDDESNEIRELLRIKKGK